MRSKSYPLPISRQINTNFRNYALYVLENRGIPSFYDGLTNVQRFIVLNSPSTFNKTISLVGSCISDGYHHGDCLDAKTQIHLADGSTIEIEEWYIKYPDAKLLVQSFDEKTQEFVVGLGHSPRIGQETCCVYEIELESGEIYKVTDNHPLLTNRGWVQAKDLTEQDEILQKP